MVRYTHPSAVLMSPPPFFNAAHSLYYFRHCQTIETIFDYRLDQFDAVVHWSIIRNTISTIESDC